MKCPNCNGEVPEGKRFCGHCGQPLVPPGFDDDAPTRLADELDEVQKEPQEPKQKVQTCPACGIQYPPKARFCNGCGTSLTGIARSVAPAPVATRAKRPLPGWVLPIMFGFGSVAVLAVVIFIFVLVFFTPGEAEPHPTPASIAAVVTDTRSATQTAPASAPCDRAAFIHDVTIPDDAAIAPGDIFTKTWRLENAGSCTWTSAYSLVFDHGDVMGGPESAQSTTETIAPGQTVDISVDLIAPTAPGTYQGFWKLRNPDGEAFGLTDDGSMAFWVKIRVEAAQPQQTPYDGGGQLVFESTRGDSNDIFVMDYDGNNITQLTQNNVYDGSPDWWLGGTRIVFYSERDGDYGQYAMDVDGGNVVRFDYGGSWSPDGNRIAFASNRDGDSEIFLIDSEGNNEIQLTDNSARDWNPLWSPDGTRIVFESIRNGGFELYLMDSDGANVIQLTNNGYYDYDADWSPNGTRIAFVSTRDGDEEIYVMNVDGSNVVQLTHNDVSDGYPSWSPDGTKIAFSSIYRGYDQIFIIDVETGETIQVTYNDPDYGHNFAPSWSP
jgi:Tol biopolymer transport system component